MADRPASSTPVDRVRHAAEGGKMGDPTQQGYHHQRHEENGGDKQQHTSLPGVQARLQTDDTNDGEDERAQERRERILRHAVGNKQLRRPRSRQLGSRRIGADHRCQRERRHRKHRRGDDLQHRADGVLADVAGEMIGDARATSPANAATTTLARLISAAQTRFAGRCGERASRCGPSGAVKATRRSALGA